MTGHRLLGTGDTAADLGILACTQAAKDLSPALAHAQITLRRGYCQGHIGLPGEQPVGALMAIEVFPEIGLSKKVGN